MKGDEESNSVANCVCQPVTGTHSWIFHNNMIVYSVIVWLLDIQYIWTRPKLQERVEKYPKVAKF